MFNLSEQCNLRMLKIGRLIHGTDDIDDAVVDNSHLLDANKLVNIFKTCMYEMALGLKTSILFLFILSKVKNKKKTR